MGVGYGSILGAEQAPCFKYAPTRSADGLLSGQVSEQPPIQELRTLNNFKGILCVDDDLTIHEQVDDVLGMMFPGVLIRHANDGFAGLESLAEFQESYPGGQLVILCDNKMGQAGEIPTDRMNGPEMLERMRQMELEGQIPYHHAFFHTSSNCGEGLLRRIEGVGASYVMKQKYYAISKEITQVTGVVPSIILPPDFDY